MSFSCKFSLVLAFQGTQGLQMGVFLFLPVSPHLSGRIDKTQKGKLWQNLARTVPFWPSFTCFETGCHEAKPSLKFEDYLELSGPPCLHLPCAQIMDLSPCFQWPCFFNQKDIEPKVRSELLVRHQGKILSCWKHVSKTCRE